MVKEKDVNAVLGYMEQKGKVPTVLAIAPPAVSEKDTLALMNPGSCFNEATRQNLKQSYVGLFNARTKFYANFDRYLSYLKAKDYSKADKLLDVNFVVKISPFLFIFHHLTYIRKSLYYSAF